MTSQHHRSLTSSPRATASQSDAITPRHRPALGPAMSLLVSRLGRATAARARRGSSGPGSAVLSSVRPGVSALGSVSPGVSGQGCGLGSVLPGVDEQRQPGPGDASPRGWIVPCEGILPAEIWERRRNARQAGASAGEWSAATFGCGCGQLCCGETSLQ